MLRIVNIVPIVLEGSSGVFFQATAQIEIDSEARFAVFELKASDPDTLWKLCGHVTESDAYYKY